MPIGVIQVTTNAVVQVHIVTVQNGTVQQSSLMSLPQGTVLSVFQADVDMTGGANYVVPYKLVLCETPNPPFQNACIFSEAPIPVIIILPPSDTSTDVHP